MFEVISWVKVSLVVILIVFCESEFQGISMFYCIISYILIYCIIFSLIYYEIISLVK